MPRRRIKVAVECGEAVVGRPLAVTAVVRARRDVKLIGVAVAFGGRWVVLPGLPTPYTVGVGGGKESWGVVTLVTADAPVTMAAGEERRWQADAGAALFPTQPTLGVQSIEYNNIVEAAVFAAGSLWARLASKPVVVGSQRWVNEDLAGLVVRRDERVWVQAKVANVMPGGTAVLATMPGAGATAELIREERRIRFRPLGRPKRKRKRFGRTTAGPDGIVALGIPDGAAPTMRHSQGEVRWYARIGAYGGVAEVELNVFNAT